MRANLLPTQRKRLLCATAAMVVAAVAMPSLSVSVARAQDASMRGTITEDEILLRRLLGVRVEEDDQQRAGIEPDPYEPASQGAVEDAGIESVLAVERPEPGAGEPAPSVAGDDPFADNARNGSDGSGPLVSSARQERETATERDDLIETGTIDERGRYLAADPMNEPQGQRDIREDTNPYAPLGIRAGSFTLFPSLEQGISASIDRNGTDYTSETTLRLSTESDFSRHSAGASGFVTLSKPVSPSGDLDVSFGGSANTTIDYAGGYRGTFSVDASRAQASDVSQLSTIAFDEDPYVTEINGSIGIEKDIGSVTGGLRLKIDRYHVEDTTSGGTPVDLDGRRYTYAGLALRGTFNNGAAIRPFIEAEIGRRFYDTSFSTGYIGRDLMQYALRGGLDVDLSEKLKGEVSAGVVHEDFLDARLDSVTGITVDGNLDWSPARGTTVSLGASTGFEAGDGLSEGNITYATNLNVSREVLANLTLNAGVGVSHARAFGTAGDSTTFNANVGALWWMNRYAGLTGRVSYENTNAANPADDSETVTVFAGIRLQR